jgi:hypothetical protein
MRSIVSSIAIRLRLIAISRVTVLYKQGLYRQAKEVGNCRESLENWLDINKDLRQVILLYKGSTLARTVDKYQRTLIAISNYSLRVY